MSRIFTVNYTGAIAASADIFEVETTTFGHVSVHSIEVDPIGVTYEEGISLLLKRGTTGTTSGTGTARTLVAIHTRDISANFGFRGPSTTKMAVGTGTITTLRAWNWSTREHFYKVFTPECRPVLIDTQRLTLELMTAPFASMTVSVTVVCEEMT